LRPMKNHINCWKKNALFLKSDWSKKRAELNTNLKNSLTVEKIENTQNRQS
jgi:hypothetical protein